MTYHAVVYLTRRAQFCVRHPMDDVLPELPVNSATAVHVAQVTDKVLEVKAGSGCVTVAVALAVLADDGGSDVVLVPRLEARVFHKLVLECGNQALERVSDDEELKISVQSVETKTK